MKKWREPRPLARSVHGGEGGLGTPSGRGNGKAPINGVEQPGSTKATRRQSPRRGWHRQRREAGEKG